MARLFVVGAGDDRDRRDEETTLEFRHSAEILAQKTWDGYEQLSLGLVAGASLTLIRTGGMSGEADSDIHWRWAPTPEERLLAQAGDDLVVPPSAMHWAEKATAGSRSGTKQADGASQSAGRHAG